MKALSPLFACAALIAACAGAPALFPELANAKVEAITSSGTHGFQVWIADDDESRARGLMFVDSLPEDAGMLFLFDIPQPAAFWMKNTYVSLDIVFIRADGTVVNIARGTRPLSLDPIESDGPVTGVLEVVAGTADRIGLRPGDRVVHAAFAAGVRKP